MAFQRGAQAAEAERESSRLTSDFDKFEFLTSILKKENDETFLRFVHDGHEWYFAKTHFENTKPADPSWDKEAKDKWPKRMPAVCRHDKNIGEDDCYWCDAAHEFVPNPDTKDWKRVELRGHYVPKMKYLIPAVVRKPIIATQEMIDSGEVQATKFFGGEERSMLGLIVGYEDVMVEVDEKDAEGKPTGKKLMRPRVIVCDQSYANFVAGLQAEWETACTPSGTGTILDKDFRCKRTGEGFETKYPLSVVNVTPKHDLSDPKPVWCLTHDLRGEGEDGALVCPECAGDAELAEASGEPFTMPKLVPLKARYDTLDIEGSIVRQASADYYARFFDRRVPRPGEQPQEGLDKAAEEEGEPAFASRETDQEREEAKAAIRASMRKGAPAEQPVG